MTKEERLERDGWDGIEPVLFYSPKDHNGIGSNFSNHRLILPHPFTGDDALYDTGEHRYQAMKAVTFEEHEKIRKAGSAFLAKKYGAQTLLRDGWGNDYGDLCWYVMVETISAKTLQNRAASKWLESTEDRLIYEDSPTDDIWGWRFENHYVGKNLLGRSWMEVRRMRGY